MKRSRSGVLALVVVLTCGAVSPPFALAGDDTVFNGYMSQGGGPVFGPQHSINRGTTRKEGYSGYMCGQASKDGVGVGEGICSRYAGIQIDKNYCACELRKFVAYEGRVGPVTGVVRQYW